MALKAHDADRVLRVLDEACLDIRRQGAARALARLIPALDEAYDSAVAASQLEGFKRDCRAHPLWELLQEDPYTNRAFTKPRGYPGDAVTLDYVYSRRAPDSTSSIGAELFAATTGSAIGDSTRLRRDLIASRIESLVKTSVQVTVASFACGHLRETQGVGAVERGVEVVAVDQDGRSLDVVRREQIGPRLRALEASITDLLRGRLDLPPCDFIYCSGLYDYLSDRLAARLTERLLGRLKVGGSLMIANFASGTYGRGYLSGIMDWDLVYRSEAALVAAFGAWRAPVHTRRDPQGNVIFAETWRLPGAVQQGPGKAGGLPAEEGT